MYTVHSCVISKTLSCMLNDHFLHSSLCLTQLPPKHILNISKKSVKSKQRETKISKSGGIYF